MSSKSPDQLELEKKAHDQGYEAYEAGNSETDNPYLIDDDLHMSWNKGFNEASDDADPDDQDVDNEG